MHESPEVALLQHASGIMQVVHNIFENGITYFTRLIYTSIQFAVGSGDCAPFVGHNTFIRWKAIQSISWEDEETGKTLFWSEAHVSEDFDVSLRLQMSGFTVRLATYHDGGFEEGVSLTVYDELARWEKYAYGCNELVFYPITRWVPKGIVTPLFRRFIFSKRMPLQSKFTISSYIGTYYAIGSALPLTLVNYFVVGWLSGTIDHYYIDSFKIFIALIYVFTALGNVSLAVLRYRTGEKGLFAALLENFSWILLFAIFLSGISLHMSKALLCHMFGINITWGATNKEKEDINFFQEIPRVIRTFKYTFLMCIMLTGMMIAFVFFVPHEWRIDGGTAIYPLAMVTISHFAVPIFLNPNLMLFTW